MAASPPVLLVCSRFRGRLRHGGRAWPCWPSTTPGQRSNSNRRPAPMPPGRWPGRCSAANGGRNQRLDRRPGGTRKTSVSPTHWPRGSRRAARRRPAARHREGQRLADRHAPRPWRRPPPAGSRIDVIATTTASQLVVGNLKKQLPALADARIAVPEDYRWPTFLKTDNLLNVANRDRGDRDHRRGHDDGDHHRRHRSVGGQPGGAVGGADGQVDRRFRRPAGHAGDHGALLRWRPSPSAGRWAASRG